MPTNNETKVTMNKLLALALSMCIALPSWAEGDEHDNRLYFTMSDVAEKHQVALTLYLENPSVELTAVEVYVALPEGASMSEGELTARAAQHELKEGPVGGRRFVSIASPSLTTFAGSDGGLCTWLCDFSQMPSGEHRILISGLFAVGVNDTDITPYVVEEQQLTITLDGNITGVAVPSGHCGRLLLYDLRGQRIALPQQGQVYVVNGKKRLAND